MCFSLLLCMFGNLYNKRDSSVKGRRVHERERNPERKKGESGRQGRKDGRKKAMKEGMKERKEERRRKEGSTELVSEHEERMV